MSLKTVSDIANQLAQMIARLLGVDVMVVDSNLERISNTYRTGEVLYPVKRDSNVGQVIQRGRPLIIDRPKNYPACMGCPGRNNCNVDGFIGVPIFCNDAVIGALALIVPITCSLKIFSNAKNILAFLEQAASLLSSVVCAADENKDCSPDISTFCRMIPGAVAAADAAGRLAYYNTEFAQLFPEVAHSREPRMDDIPGMASLVQIAHVDSTRRSVLFSAPGPNGFWGVVENLPFTNGRDVDDIYVFRSMQNQAAFRAVEPQQPFFDVLHVYPPLQGICQQAQKRMENHSPVVLYGERGSGKMLVAEFLHRVSPTRNGAFFVFDCMSYPPALHKRILFGQQRCSDESIGLFIRANKGTFVFQNVEYLSLDAQRLMATTNFHFASGEQFGVVGQLDIQTIYTTSAPISGSTPWTQYDPVFFSKILSKPLEIKPLRENRKDILPLLQHFIRQYADDRKYGHVELTEDLMQMVHSYDWWGNINELQKAAERIVDSVRVPPIDVVDIISPRQTEQKKSPISVPVDREREKILSYMRQHISKTEIAGKLGISRATLYRKLRDYHIS